VALEQGGGTPQLCDALVRFLREVSVVADAAAPLPRDLAADLDPPLSALPPLHYLVLEAPLQATAEEIAKKYAEQQERLQRRLVETMQAGEIGRALDAQSKLTRLEEANAVLSDAQKRAEYDRQCVPAKEHAFHNARLQFISDLHDFSAELVRRKAMDLVTLLVRAYEETPHERLDAYFEAQQPGMRKIIRENMAGFSMREFLDQSRELMDNDRWKEARNLLTLAHAIGGQHNRWIQYRLAWCELKLEIAHIREQGTPSAPGIKVSTAARARLTELGGKTG
jgi:hypothetical protein